MRYILLLLWLVVAAPALAQDQPALPVPDKPREKSATEGQPQPLPRSKLQTQQQLQQQLQPQKENPALRGVALSVQTVSNSIELYVADVTGRLAAKDAEIEDLKKKCGDPCKGESK